MGRRDRGLPFRTEFVLPFLGALKARTRRIKGTPWFLQCIAVLPREHSAESSRIFTSAVRYGTVRYGTCPPFRAKGFGVAARGIVQVPKQAVSRPPVHASKACPGARWPGQSALRRLLRAYYLTPPGLPNAGHQIRAE